MADKKITALTATSSVVDADIFPIVVDVAGTPTTKKVTALDLGTYVTDSIVFPTVDFSSDQSVLAGAVFNS
jgi:hypothetical protein